MSEEIELKLEVPEGAAERLLAQPWLKGGRSQEQCSVYFDTPASLLRGRGYTLRVRTVGGRYIQTVKSLDGGAGLFERGEWEYEIEQPMPDLARLAHTPLAGLDLGDLVPVVRSDVTRTTCLLHDDSAEIELAIDRGEMRAGRRRTLVSEVEIELLRGDSSAAVAVARRVASAVPVKLGVLSKAERGFALASGKLGKVAKAEKVRVRADMTVAEGFAVILGSCLRHYRLNEALVIAKRRPEALHQARVAMRRLRAALSLFRSALADAEYEALRVELRWFTSQLGDARNLDVYIASLAQAETGPELLKRREAAYGRVVEAMDSDRVRSLLLDLVAWARLGEWRGNANAQRPLGPYASRRIDRIWRRVSGTRHVDRMDEHERHLLRIRIKKLRYALEFVETLFAQEGERQKNFADALEELQEELGHLNDLAVARTLVSSEQWPIEPHYPAVDERESLKKAAHALGRLRHVGAYWREQG